MLSLIYCQDLSGGIGYKGNLPWHLPSDLRRFKALTSGHTTVMGRLTFESLPEAFRPLPGRKNVVVTSTKDYTAHPEVQVVHDLAAYLQEASTSQETVFVIGGQTLYEAAVDLAQDIHRTTIHSHFKTDRRFSLDDKDFVLYNEEVGRWPKDVYDNTYEHLKRKPLALT